ncbi:ATP-binding protein [Cryomorphaceae bacterium 1068]|nr:ATP-binding protein [Cryomorphaceae bacterium 1068]
MKMKTGKKISSAIALLYGILLGIVNPVFAQPDKIPFEKYGVTEGLPEEFAIELLQDDKGFMWCATQNGLVKYDGYNFKVYKATDDPKDTTQLQLRNLFGGMLKAKDGKIWMGGSMKNDRERGISCFDPETERFKNYTPKVGNTSVQSFLELLLEDEERNIWFRVTTNSREETTICRLNPQTGAISKYTVPESRAHRWRHGNIAEAAHQVWLLDTLGQLQKWNPDYDAFDVALSTGTISSSAGQADTLRSLFNGKDDRLLLTGDHGLYIFDAKTEKVVRQYVSTPDESNGLSDKKTVSAIEDSTGQFWVFHEGATISMINPDQNTITVLTYGSGPLLFDQSPDYLRLNEKHHFQESFQDKEGIWLQPINPDSYFIEQFSMHYSFATKEFRFYDAQFNVENNRMNFWTTSYGFMEDQTGLLWLNTRPGFYKQAPKKQQMDLFLRKESEADGLPSDTINFLFEDSKQRLWVGTENGLALFQPANDNFLVFQNDVSNAGSLSDDRVQFITEDVDGGIWVCTRNGLNKLQESTTTFERFFFNNEEPNLCAFLHPDTKGRLWLSISDKGVFVLDHTSGAILKSFVSDPTNPASLTSQRISSFYQDSRGNIWLSDADGGEKESGLFRLNESEDGFTRYQPVAEDSTSIADTRVFFVVEDEQKQLLIAQNNGLDIFDYEHDEFIHKGNWCTVGYAIDLNGNFHFGTYSGDGLAAIDKTSGEVTFYGEEQGLLHNDIVGSRNYHNYAMDHTGKIWLPNQRGLSVFDPEKKSFTSYFEKDGFQPNGRRYCEITTANGDVWIGGSNGLNRIVPADLLKKDPSVPAVVITKVSVDNRIYSIPDGEIFKKAVAYTDAISLEHWQKDVGFEFVALHYLRSEDNQYSWKLENYDNDWSLPSKARSASYTNLSPGKYTFRVKASNADGVWNEEGESIIITINPPWWLTWWAYSIYGLLFLAGLRIFSKWRERNLRMEKEKLELSVAERTTELEASLETVRSTQAQLIQAEKMASLGELTAGIAHEIQNPLNFVNNFSEVSNELIDEMAEEMAKGDVEEAAALAADIKANLEKITHHGKRADAIVKGMLAHSRSGKGEKTPTNLNALAEEYLKLSYHGLRAKDKSFNADFKTDFDPELPKVNVVPQDIGRVLLNLINNAFQACAQSGTENPIVTVTTKRTTSDALRISISDNGPGIPPDIKDKIFQPFFTTKPTGQGTGLGLSLSYDIVKAHGGEIKISNNEGGGADFCITLPTNA